MSLRLFADELIRFTGSPVPAFRDWIDAIQFLFRLADDRSVPVVIDEFPFLARVSPSLPSIIARELGPGRKRREQPGAPSALRLGHVGDGWAARGSGAAARPGRN
ncbi:MAG TPA: hypothetical protein VHZ33_10860 [Trebonia sp.]|nr:hypothetical protein [Trebonia sp.]